MIHRSQQNVACKTTVGTNKKWVILNSRLVLILNSGTHWNSKKAVSDRNRGS